ncbi:HlyD family secretion protein [Glaciecola sp. KUL10]|uniref:HlyD family secretion protein n=1 Tax=Glaciecola sp. (strain KUL10) TaxID=2161813 RepID=UPI000D783505|nr:HlyD family efflux transporter periplasmic adaptor subunit [Glaciecola sp. KUL10]GBL05157.1 membrane-fusion protein [Glaciecola sp. KUL10]
MQRQQTLYRKEAIDYQSSDKLGTAILLPKRQHILVSLALFSMFGAGMVALANSSFANKVKVKGWIISPEGIHSVNHFEASGLVSEVLVKDGELVEKNQALLKIKRTQAFMQGDELLQQNRITLEARIKNVGMLLARHEAKTINDIVHQNAHLKRLLSAEDLLREQHTLLTEQIKVMSQQSTNYSALVSDRLLTQQTLDTHMQKLAEMEMRERQIQVELLTTAQNINAVEQTIAQLEHTQNNFELEQQATINNLKLELASHSQNNEYTVYAPKAGKVSALQVYQGSDLSKHKTLLKILGERQQHRAKLYIPSASIGLIEHDQTVTIRLDAFPYQQYGAIEGQLTQVSQSVLMPDELPANPLGYQQPVFEALVQLKQTGIKVDGRSVGFKHGMTFEASVKLDDRNIIEWLLAPIYRLKGAL